MYVLLRFYNRFDLDLIGLWQNGYPLGQMTKRALIAYTKKESVCFRTSSAPILGMPRKHIQISITISDKDSIRLLKQIRPRYRNSFCKMLLRQYLPRQSLAPYHMADEFLLLEEKAEVFPFSGTCWLDPMNLKEKKAGRKMKYIPEIYQMEGTDKARSEDTKSVESEPEENAEVQDTPKTEVSSKEQSMQTEEPSTPMEKDADTYEEPEETDIPVESMHEPVTADLLIPPVEDVPDATQQAPDEHSSAALDDIFHSLMFS